MMSVVDTILTSPMRWASAAVESVINGLPRQV